MSTFGLAIFYTQKTLKNYRENQVPRKYLLNEPASDRRKGAVTPVTVVRSPATSRNGNNMSGHNCGHSDDRLREMGGRRLEIDRKERGREKAKEIERHRERDGGERIREKETKRDTEKEREIER